MIKTKEKMIFPETIEHKELVTLGKHIWRRNNFHYYVWKADVLAHYEEALGGLKLLSSVDVDLDQARVIVKATNNKRVSIKLYNKSATIISHERGRK